jgi:predicted nucleic acid-binding protein
MLVVDASVVCKLFIDEPDSGAALRLFDTDTPLLAPDIVVAEVCNAVWRAVRLGKATDRQLDLASTQAPRIFADLCSGTLVIRSACVMARELSHSVYDCLYLAVAEREGVQLVTADQRFVAKLVASRWQGIARPLTDWAAA